ncbi:pimeloyl-ACP methyl ester carboxylesterase [Saccharothrix ecbatanensis]|uniref:Pimeloyl-ACP methyl ester carboxylesterase n=1 Tax=Saccharothrix ecbatanensis TaxID=1105145 RepID=A0A7W9M152_9PSEU|nr:alpha/beta fold hydrolase [Saccharothrix ecbatanensis]MBB5803605.1 pimeloyl-ACP methyl ester carboxylesterase [Saccharothrix ecbatanensis]
MTHSQSGTVPIAGGSLYYEVRGTGWNVLVVQGGIGDANATGQLVDQLVDDGARVITYDRRGLGRSTVDDTAATTIGVHAADAAALLQSVTEEPAVVAGASIGAVIALQLAVDHPELVASVIAHEPPLSDVVREPDRERELDHVAELASTDARAAIRHMVSLAGQQPELEPGAAPARPTGDLKAALTRFFAHDFPAVRTSGVNADRLRPVVPKVPITLTGGTGGSERWEYRCARELARDLDVPFVDIDGGHEAAATHPRGTAAAISRLAGVQG